MFIEQLIAMIESGDYGLDWWNRDDTKDLDKWRAFRFRDKTKLKALVGWKPNRPYKADSIAKRIATAFSDFMFNDPPIIAAEIDEDQTALMNPLLSENRFTSKIRKAADTCVSEGKVWYRIYTNQDVLLYPIIEFSSDTEVISLMLGDAILAAGFVHVHKVFVGEEEKTYRHIEFYEKDRVVNKLYVVDDEKEAKLGNEVALTEHPQLSEDSPPMTEEWTHELGLLCGRIKNEDEAESVYWDVEDFLLDLNEAHTIDSENFRLAGKKRASIPKKYQDQAGEMDPGEEIFWTEEDFNEMEQGDGPIRIMEYTYEADNSIKRKDDLERIILTRVGLSRQLVDANADEGLAQTGTALRTRLLPTLAAISGKTREWADELPKLIHKMQRVDALPEHQGGFGRPWKSEMEPSVTISAPLPVDASEEAVRHQTLISAELESIETAIEELHPNWSSERKILEIRRILANRDGVALDDQGNIITIEGSEDTSETDEIVVEPESEEEPLPEEEEETLVPQGA